MKARTECPAGRGTGAARLEDVARRLRVMAHPCRLRIVELLDARKAAPVHAIVDALGIPQAVASQHLAQMKLAGIAVAERRGKEVWYRLRDRRCRNILACLNHP